MDPEAYKKYNRKEQGATPGIYKHPETNEKLIAQEFPIADALVRQGWVREAELPDAKELRAIHSQDDKAEESAKKGK